MNKILPWSTRLFALFAFLFLFATNSFAWEIRQGDQVTLPKTESFEGSLIVMGQSVIIDSPVDGDLFCVGRKIIINADVTGDILCAGQSIDITGRVGGNIRAASQDLNINSVVTRNANLFGQSITLGSDSVINGELFTAGNLITIDGLVKKSWVGTGESIDLGGRVESDATLTTNNLSLDQAATVTGGITRYSHDKNKVKDSAKQKFWMGPEAATKGFNFAGKILGLISGLILGMLAIWLFPKWLKRAASVVNLVPGKSLLIGLLVWLLAPVVIVITTVTLVGIPLAVLLMLALFIVGGLSWTVAGTALGLRLNLKKATLTQSWLVGYLILSVLGWLPGFGWLIHLAVILVGTGAIKRSLLKSPTQK